MVLTLGNKSKPDARYTQSLCLNTNFTGKILQGPFVLKALFPHHPPITSHLEVQPLIEENGCKAISFPQLFRKSSHWPAGEDLSERLSTSGASKGAACGVLTCLRNQGLWVLCCFHTYSNEKRVCYKGFVTKMLPPLILMSVARKKRFFRSIALTVLLPTDKMKSINQN